MTSQLIINAVRQWLSTIGWTCEAFGECGLIVRRSKATGAVYFSLGAPYPITTTVFEDVDFIVFAGIDPQETNEVERCPRLTGRVVHAQWSELISTLCIVSETSTDPRRRVAASCDIDCVFETQLQGRLSQLRHDLLGTYIKIGIGRRCGTGTATRDDLTSIAEHAARDLNALESGTVACSFLKEREHAFVRALEIVKRLKAAADSKDLAAGRSDVAGSIKELHAVVNSQRSES